MKTYKNKLAFSLIELSVVILIVGILVVGVSQGSRIISEARLKTARSLTNSSPVHAMPGLVLWLDSTNIENIATGTVASNQYGNPGDEEYLVHWKDQNSKGLTDLIFSAPNDANRPIFLRNSSNGLPAIKFEANSEYLLSSSQIGITQLTEFVVYKSSSKGSQALLLNSGDPADATLYLNLDPQDSPPTVMYRKGIHGFGSGGFVYVNKFTIFSYVDYIRSTGGFGARYFINGDHKGTAGATTLSSIIPSQLYISSTNSAWGLEGELSEIILFSRTLKDSEREAVEKYLAQKYKIKISN